MKSRVTVPVLLAAVTALLAFSTLGTRAQQVEENPIRQGELEAARAKLVAAERVCRMFHDPESGAPRGDMRNEANYLWSKRRMMAEIEVILLDPSHGSEQDAIRRHLEWMQAWAKTVSESGAFSKLESAQSEFYIAEAEARLASVTHR